MALVFKVLLFSVFINAAVNQCLAQSYLSPYNISWDKPSENALESMPCGGGDIGLNVWVENGDLLIYLSQSGTFDELNAFLKPGRVRITLNPNPFIDGTLFNQTLKLEQGYVEIRGEKNGCISTIKVWVDVFYPIINADVSSNEPIDVVAAYESWRFNDRELQKLEPDMCRSYLGAPYKPIIRADSISFTPSNEIEFYHQNRNDSTVFDMLVEQQKLETVKDKLWNPNKNRIFGGIMFGENMQSYGISNGQYASTPYKSWLLKSKTPVKNHTINICLQTTNVENIDDWRKAFSGVKIEARKNLQKRHQKTINWWREFWNRSYICIDHDEKNKDTIQWQIGRNYQLFRYQLGCNAYGRYPTKFNGGLFTVDPVFIDTIRPFTPDFRRWGGGSFTAQNQRLVYWPMLKSGDFDMMKPQFDFYLNMLRNAELRSLVYWGHSGACFTEQIENFGLPVAFEYKWKRPVGFDDGVSYNAWVEYHWDTALEFCYMILDYERFTGCDISEYLPLIESCLRFFDQHYQYRSSMRTPKMLDENGHLVIYPGTACETYKMATNPVTTIAALRSVITRALELDNDYWSDDQRDYLLGLGTRIPPISFRNKNGYQTISPAKSWERINNVELPQLYPVFPYGIYGIGKPGIDIAINTWRHGIDRPDQKQIKSWHQDAIFCARLGLINEAADLTIQKLKNADQRFPTFWGPGHDWVPDHNWGGSGMIGLQEMLMQTDSTKIYLFPAWPKDWDVKFKLHAPFNTIVEGQLENGKIIKLQVTPKERSGDIICLPFND
ncbi:MAG: hypothetical protein JW717_13965 [Marinilabiliaceae bacterium]|nr:hypothetical protein [Marinilabiliaceae bacterium]